MVQCIESYVDLTEMQTSLSSPWRDRSDKLGCSDPDRIAEPIAIDGCVAIAAFDALLSPWP
jgi:hypothetical protein